jgi:hypothetical protein
MHRQRLQSALRRGVRIEWPEQECDVDRATLQGGKRRLGRVVDNLHAHIRMLGAKAAEQCGRYHVGRKSGAAHAKGAVACTTGALRTVDGTLELRERATRAVGQRRARPATARRAGRRVRTA